MSLQSCDVRQCLILGRRRYLRRHEHICFTMLLSFCPRAQLLKTLTHAVLQVLEQRLSAVAEIRASGERVAMWGQTKCPALMCWTCR